MFEFAAGIAVGYASLTWFWMLAVVFLLCVSIVLSEAEQYGWTVVPLAAIGLVAWLGAGVNPVTWVWVNLAIILQCFFVYLLVGAAWSFGKWYLYLIGVREKLLAARERHQQRPNHTQSMPTRPRESYARNNKGRLTGWIACWPFSMLGTLFGDVLTRVFKEVYRLMTGLYDRLGNRVFLGLEDE